MNQERSSDGLFIATSPRRTGDPDDPAADAYPLQRGRTTERLASAASDEKLAGILLELARSERLAAVAGTPVFQRETLARMFALRAEAALEAPGSQAEEMAELVVAVAATLPRGPRAPRDKVAELAAFGEWLLGKAQLCAGRWAEAERTFRLIPGRLPNRRPSELRALSCAGIGELCWQRGATDDAAVFLDFAAQIFARLQQTQQWAACHVLSGMLFPGRGSNDLDLARGPLESAESLIDPVLAPSLAILVLLAVAHCHALSGKLPATDRYRANARMLLLARLGGARPRSVQDLTRALAETIPGDGERWAKEIEQLAPLVDANAERLRAAVLNLFRDAGVQPGSCAAAGLPLSLVTLSDRLLLHRGEDEEPHGSAAGL